MNKRIIKTLTAATVISMVLSNSVIFADGVKSQNEMKLEHNIKAYVHKDNKHGNQYKYNKHDKEDRDEDEIVGTIVKVYGNKIEVKDNKGKVYTFKASNKTEIEYEEDDDKQLSFKDLKVGMVVEVEFDDDYKNQHHIDAEEITILSEISDDDDNDDNEIINRVIIESANVENINGDSILINNNGVKIILNITKDTKFFNQFGKVINQSDIKKGMVIKVEHSAIMTRSMPGQTNAISISIVKEQEENVKLEKQVVSVDNKGKTVTIGDKENYLDQIVLRINDDTKLFDQYNRAIKLEDIKAGMTLSIEHSKSMTRSIPAQTNALSIQIVKSRADSILLSTEVLEVLQDRILVGDKADSSTYKYLLINNETIILDKNGNSMRKSDIKSGMSITVEHSLISTLSLPPQTQAYIITINK